MALCKEGARLDHMSIWRRIGDAVQGLTSRGESLSAFFERKGRNGPEQSVAFTIAVIGLGAKMAKADGTVAASEVSAFREVFKISEDDEAAAGRVFDLARQDIAGFESYAKQIAHMFANDPAVLEDILEGLFHIAMADGAYHAGEESFLSQVAKIFGTSAAAFASIEARHVSGRPMDPWQILGVPRGTDFADVRARWRELIRENHPDRMIARGLSPEHVTLANDRVAAINAAWEEIIARSATEPDTGRR